MDEAGYEVWKSKELSSKYLTGIRGAIPFAAEQLEILTRVVDGCAAPLRKMLDLGCGDGILAAAVRDSHPEIAAVLVDFSETMIEAARKRLGTAPGMLDFLTLDYSDKSWIDRVSALGPFDLVVSGFSIHHQPDERKKTLYREIFDLLVPGGLFLNLEHVLSASEFGRRLFNEQFIDSLYGLHVRQDPSTTREKVADEYYHREDKAANILAPVEVQCRWLSDIGFRDVDCFFRVFELALFGGRKP